MTASLTDLERRLVARLRRGEGEPVPRAALLRDVWNVPATTSTRTVDMAISRLRRKLPEGALTSVHGLGYLYQGEEEAPPAERIHLLDGWIEPSTGRLRRGENETRLSGRQHTLMKLLGQTPGRPVSRTQAAEALDIPPASASAPIRALLFRLRRKVEVDPKSPNHLVALPGGAIALLPAEGTEVETRQNLPERDSAWVGRACELERVEGWLERPGLYLLSGPPGVGKSRLAEEAARRGIARRGLLPGGVWYCDARSARSAEDLWEELAATLAITRAGELPVLVTQSLAARGGALLLVDNVEQLPATADAVWGDLQEAAPDLRILLTSRRGVDTKAGELRLAPLEREDARALLHDRLGDGAGLGDRALDDLIERLDGLPLALEGLAAQLSASGVKDAARVSALQLPAGAITLRDVLTQSLDSLPAAARRGLGGLALFEGAFDGPMAAGVLGDGWVEVVSSLEHHCLVERRPARWPEPDETWRMLQVVRELARRALRADGGLDAAREAVHKTLLVRAEQAARGLNQPRPRRWLERLRRMRSDLRTAARRLAREEPGNAARFWLAQSRLLRHAGTPPQLLAAAARAHGLAQTDGEERLIARAATARSRAWYAGAEGDPLKWADEAQEIAESLDDALLQAQVARARTRQHLIAGRLEETAAAIDRWLIAADRPGAEPLRTMARVNLANLQRKRPTRDPAEVEALLEAAFVESAELGDTNAQLWAVEMLAIRLCNDGETDQLAALLERAGQRDLLPYQQRFMVQMQAAVRRQRGDYEDAKMRLGLLASAPANDTFDRQMSRIRINLGFLHLLLGEGAAAERQVKAAGEATRWSKQPDVLLTVATAVTHAERKRYRSARAEMEALLADPVLGRGVFAFVAAAYLPAVLALGGDRAAAAEAMGRLDEFEPAARLAWSDVAKRIGAVFAGLEPRPADPRAWLLEQEAGDVASRSEDILILLRWMERLEG